MNKQKAVVTGMGIFSSVGKNVDEFYNSILNGKSGISKIELFNAESFRSLYGGEIKDYDPSTYFSKKDLVCMDRASQITLIAAGEALAQAGLNPDEIDDKSRIGVCLGSTLGGTIMGMEYYEMLLKNRMRPSWVLDYPLYSAGSRICMKYGWLGANTVISSACASGNLALGYSLDLIRSGSMDVMITGGFDTLCRLTNAGFGVLRNMTEGEIVQPFDKNRKGLLLGEGAGILVMESEAFAKKRKKKGFAEIMGYGSTSDAYHMTAPDISASGPSQSMQNAISDSGLKDTDIDYINAHGTATQYNDMIESKAIKKVFGERAMSIPVSSTKSMIGHTLGACGGIEAIVAILAINNSFVPPTINYETPDPKCDLDYVPNKARTGISVNYVLSNNFGFGGNNCSVVYGKYEPHD